jgi:hypothetical protein
VADFSYWRELRPDERGSYEDSNADDCRRAVPHQLYGGERQLRDESVFELSTETIGAPLRISAAGSALTIKLYRWALDRTGADSVEAHYAQIVAWEELMFLLGQTKHSVEEVAREREYWLSVRPSANDELPADVIVFKKNGVILGELKNLAIPIGYSVL